MSGGYVPLFASLTTGTLCGRWPDVGLWPIVLSLSDKYGRVDVTPMYLAQVTGLPVDDVVACMKRFCEPDPFSRTDAENGARLTLIDEHRDWGWKIVNHLKYREKARKQAQQKESTESGNDAGRKREERERAKSGDVPRSPASPAESSADRPSDANAYENANSKNQKAVRNSKAAPSQFHAEVIGAYHRLCPALPRIKGWPAHRRAALDARIKERCDDGKPADSVAYWESFFTSVAASDFLCGRTKEPFTASIDWLLGPKNFLKVIEDNYRNRSTTNGAHHHA